MRQTEQILWIPCDEAMPPEDGTYIATISGFREPARVAQGFAHYSAGAEYPWTVGGLSVRSEAVKAWAMPMKGYDPEGR